MGGLAGFQFLLKTPTDNAIAKGENLPNDSDFQTIGGFVANSSELTATEIDITNKSSNQNKELLDGHGIVSQTLSGNGILQRSKPHVDLEVNLFEQELRWFQLTRSDGRSFTGVYKVTSFQVEGANDQAVTFSITLMSSGTLYIKDESGFAFDTGANRITAFNNLQPSLNLRAGISPSYELEDLPSNEAKAGLFNSFIENDSDLPNDFVEKANVTPEAPLSLSGSLITNEFAFPIIFVEKDQLVDRKLQLLDSFKMPLKLGRLNDVDVREVTYQAYFVDIALSVGETQLVTIMAG